MSATTTTATRLEHPILTTLEELKGYVAVGETDYQQGYLKGRRTDRYVLIHLRLTADDLEQCVTRPEHQMRVEGYVRCDTLWGQGPIFDGAEGGYFRLFIATPNPNLVQMVYRLHFQGNDGRPYTLSGFKEMSDDPLTNVAIDCMQLFTTVFQGRVTQEEEEAGAAEPYAVGIIKLHGRDFFVYDILGLRFKGPNKRKWRWRFLKFFFGTFRRFMKAKNRGR
jgi:cholesterol oxidase